MANPSHPLKITLIANWAIGEKMIEWLVEQTHYSIASIQLFTRRPQDDQREDYYRYLTWDKAVKLQSQGASIELLPLLKPDKLAEPLQSFQPDWVFMHAYPFILPPTILSLFPNKFINFHPSLLPKYRGADPASAVLENKEEYTGITSTIVEEGVDCGPIYHQERLKIEPNWTRSDLLNHMQSIIKIALAETFTKLSHSFEPIKQRKHS